MYIYIKSIVLYKYRIKIIAFIVERGV